MSLTPTQLQELQTIVIDLGEEFPHNADALWNAAIRIQTGGLGPTSGAGGQPAFDAAVADIKQCQEEVQTYQQRQGSPSSGFDVAVLQVVPATSTFPSGNVGEILYLDIAPNNYVATDQIVITPVGPNSVQLDEVGTTVARTVPAASGGLEINNLSTGGGFERVLTTADSQSHNAEFVTLSLDGSLANERVLTAGTDISIVDGGAGGNVTINADDQNPFATPLRILGDINLPSPPLDNITSLLEFRDLADAVTAGHVGMAGQFGRLELSNFIEGRILRLTTAEGGSTNDDAGGIEIFAGQGETPSGNGGDLDFFAGASGVGGVGAGGDIQLRAGASGSTGTLSGGDVQLIAGQGGQGGAGGAGGNVSLSAGSAGGSDSIGGEIRLNAGAGSRDGGDVFLIGGVGGTTRGGNVDITSGQSGGVALPSGDIILEVNDVTGGASGNVFVNTRDGLGFDGGTVVSSQDPGLVAIYGVGVDTNITAGNVEIWGGYANGNQNTSVGGNVCIFGGGGGGGPPRGGDVCLYGGDADEDPGDVELEGGSPTVSGPGGNIRILGGDALLSGVGGRINVTGGLGFGLNAGGEVIIVGGNSGSGATGNGADVDVRGGQALSTNGQGGHVTLDGGLGTGSGVRGQVRVVNSSLFKVEALGGDFVSFEHDGQDLNIVGFLTQDWNMSGFSGEFALRDFSTLNLFDGLFIRLHDAANADSVDIGHDGTDLNVTGFQTDNFRVLGGSIRFVPRASTTTRAGFQIQEGVAPSSPDDGDVWVTAAGGYFVRLNGVSVDLAAAPAAPTLQSVVAAGSTTTNDIDIITGASLSFADALDADIVTITVEDSTLAPAMAMVFAGNAGIEAYQFDELINCDGTGVHLPTTGRFALYRAGDSVSNFFSNSSGELSATSVAAAFRFNALSIRLQQTAAPDTNVASYGQIWVDNEAPTRLRYTDDTDDNFVVAISGGQVGGNVTVNNSFDFNTAGNFADNWIGQYFDGGNDTITLEDSGSQTNWPLYTTINIIAPGSGVLTVTEGSGVTLFNADGSDTVGGVTISQGVASITRQTASNYIVWGSGIT